MASELIVANNKGQDLALVENYALDLTFGAKDCDFEARFKRPHLKGGEFIYLDGTEYGGIVDSILADTESDETVYKGRTWYGIIASKVYLNTRVKCRARDLLREIINENDLGYIFKVVLTDHDKVELDYTLPKEEPANAYKVLIDALKSVGLKLCMRTKEGRVSVWIEPIYHIGEKLNSELTSFVAERTLYIPNHLIAYGELKGDNRDKDVPPEKLTLHLYADQYGNISDKQSLVGATEIQFYKKFSGFKHEKGSDVEKELRKQLTEKATEELKKKQKFGKADTKVLGNGDWNVGDVIEASNYDVGFNVSAEITEKVVQVESGVLTTNYKVGGDKSKAEAIAIIEDERPRKVYTWLPDGKYAPGDLWVQGDTGDILVCVDNPIDEQYNSSDWEHASKYTDDSAALEASEKAQAAKIDAEQAEIKASEAGDKAEAAREVADTAVIVADEALETSKENTQQLDTVKSEIKQLGSQIVATVTQTTVIEDRLTTAESKITQTSNSVDIKFSETEARLRDVDKEILSSNRLAVKASNEAKSASNLAEEAKARLGDLSDDIAHVSQAAAQDTKDLADYIANQPTLIRQDATGIIVGKADGDQYQDESIVTRQNASGAFEICSVLDNELIPISSFNKDRILLGSGGQQTVELGDLKLANKEVYLGTNHQQPVPVSSIEAPGVVALHASNDKNQGASIHLNAGIENSKLYKSSNLTFVSDSFSFTDSNWGKGHGNRRPNLAECEPQTMNEVLGLKVDKISFDVLDVHLRFYKYGAVVVVTCEDTIKFGLKNSGSWTQYFRISTSRFRPLSPVVHRCTCWGAHRGDFVDIKIDTDGRVYFRQHTGKSNTFYLAPNFSYISQVAEVIS